ncbi:MAG: hypothetical protein AAF485_27035 [Chloroflexota bacterium]
MKLLALNCPNCAQPLTPENDHIVTICDECGSVIQIDDTGLRPITLHYRADSAATTASHWQPFWVFQGQVNIRERENQSGRSRDDESRALWGVPRYLYIPAWNVSLVTAQEIGSRLIQQQPTLHLVKPPTTEIFDPVIATPEDALKLLEFIVLAIEARRQDWLTNLVFDVNVSEAELWALPKVT